MPRPRLETQQFIPQAAPLLLLSLIEYASAHGIPGERLCANLGFDVTDLRGGRLVSQRHAWRMIRRALKLTGRPDLGLELGRHQDLECFGLPGYAMAAAADLREAVMIGLRYQHQGGGLLAIEGQIEQGALVLSARSGFADPRVRRFLVEELFSSLLALGGILLGQALLPERVELGYPRPPYARRYREVFGVMPQFAQDGNRLVIAAEWLQRPLCVAAVASPQRELLQVLEQRDRRLPRDVAQALEQVLGEPGLSSLTITEAARLLDLSVRTLRRRLHENGTSFRAISAGVRARLAQQLLCDSDMPVFAIAQALGFSDARAFRQAFQQWCGLTPAAFRARGGSD